MKMVFAFAIAVYQGIALAIIFAAVRAELPAIASALPITLLLLSAALLTAPLFLGQRPARPH